MVSLRGQEGTILGTKFSPTNWKSYLHCNYSSKLWSSQFEQLRIEAWKSQDFNEVWTRDLAIPVRRSNQLSYEATDVGSWSFVSSKEPVKNGCEVTYEIFHIIELRILKSSKLWSSQFEQLPEKVRTSTGFEPVTSRYRCDALINWAMKPLTLACNYLTLCGYFFPRIW